MTNWIVEETSVDNLVGEFGPFETLEAAVDFAKSTLFPWSNDNMSKITIQKENAND